jgi:hypothetical protein
MNLPDPPPTTIWQDLAEFQKFAEEVQTRTIDPTQKKMLGDMLKELTEARAKAESIVPGIVQDMKKQAEAQEGERTTLEAELKRLQAELEAKKADAQKYAEQAKQPAPQPPIDPNKGRQLTDELLRRLGGMPRPPVARVSGDVWEGLTEAEEEQAKIEKQPTDKNTMRATGVAPATTWDADMAVSDDEEIAKPNDKEKPLSKPVAPEPPPPKKKPSRSNAEKEVWDTGVSEIGE